MIVQVLEGGDDESKAMMKEAIHFLNLFDVASIAKATRVLLNAAGEGVGVRYVDEATKNAGIAYGEARFASSGLYRAENKSRLEGVDHFVSVGSTSEIVGPCVICGAYEGGGSVGKSQSIICGFSYSNQLIFVGYFLGGIPHVGAFAFPKDKINEKADFKILSFGKAQGAFANGLPESVIGLHTEFLGGLKSQTSFGVFHPQTSVIEETRP